MFTRLAARSSSRYETMVSFLFLAIVVVTIVYGQWLVGTGIEVRQWDWSNLLFILPIVPLLFLQQQATLPTVETIQTKKNGWLSTAVVGMIFGFLDVLVIKVILHPQPYTELPPFLQPFPYSIFLYTSGALEIELTYRLLPLTLFLLLEKWMFKGRYRKAVLIFLGIVTSLIEPVMQFPDGVWWLIVYATVSGVAMNAWQFRSFLQYGFLGSLAVRLGHYLVWHIILGIYVQFVELG